MESKKIEGEDQPVEATSELNDRLGDRIEMDYEFYVALQNERDRYHDALQDVLEEAAKHATDEEPEGWLWIDIVLKTKRALGMVA